MTVYKAPEILEEKRAREKDVVGKMIRIYCRGKKHVSDGLCFDCQELWPMPVGALTAVPLWKPKPFAPAAKFTATRGTCGQKSRK